LGPLFKAIEEVVLRAGERHEHSPAKEMVAPGVQWKGQ
jgi:hypothetical protein